MLADISSMFLMVKVNTEDWNALMFLFWSDEALMSEPREYNMTVANFGNVCSPFGANYCLKQTADDFGRGYPAEVLYNVRRPVYVDDLLLTANTIEHGRRLVRQTQNLVAQGGFHLSKWLANHDDLIQDIPPDDKAVR